MQTSKAVQKPASTPASTPTAQDGEYASLATALESDAATVKADVDKIARELNVPVDRALSVFKSRNKQNLGKKTQDYVGRLLSVDGPRQVQTDSGPRNVASTTWAVQGSNGIEIRRLSLWQGDDRDNSALASSLEVGATYAFKGTTREGEVGKMYLGGDGFAPSQAQFPSEGDIIGGIETIAIPDLARHKNQTIFVRGIVGRYNSNPKANVAEVSHEGSGVLTVYFPEDVALGEAQDVVILGRVSVKDDGSVRLNGVRTWTLE